MDAALGNVEHATKEDFWKQEFSKWFCLEGISENEKFAGGENWLQRRAFVLLGILV